MADPGDLQEYLEGYTMKGYRVDVPVLGHAVIESYRPMGAFPYVVVRALEPVPIEKYREEKAGSSFWSTRPENIEQWERHYRIDNLPEHFENRLREGGKVSPAEFQEWDMRQKGFIKDDMVVGDSVFLTNVEVRDPQVGMIVEFEDHPMDPASKRRHKGDTGWQGRVIGKERVEWTDVMEEEDRKGKVKRTAVPMEEDVVLVEQFVPVPFMEAPEAIVPAALRPGFQSSSTPVFGYGLGHAWQKAVGSLPPGKWVDEDGNPPANKDEDYQYVLEEPMTWEEINAFCQEYYPDEPLCADQAMMLFVLPISAEDGKFRVIPEGIDPDVVERMGRKYKIVPRGVDPESVDWQFHEEPE